MKLNCYANRYECLANFEFHTQKDTGSALQCLVKGRWEIHGITSLGSNVRLPCGDVAFFTRVSSYLSWIDEGNLY